MLITMVYIADKVNNKIQVIWFEPSIDTFYTQNNNQKLLSQPVRDVKILCYLSVANTMFFKHCFFNICRCYRY